MCIRKILTVLLTLVLSHIALNQETDFQDYGTIEDSIAYLPNEEMTVDQYLELSSRCGNENNDDSAFIYLNLAEQLALLKADKGLLAQIKYQKGNFFDSQSKYSEAAEEFEQALLIFISLSDTNRIGHRFFDSTRINSK